MYATMTLKSLLAVAKERGIVGRHDMNKAQLIAALEPQAVVEIVSETVYDAEAVKEAKRRYPSEARRDAAGKVIRLGVKFNSNVPFRHKPYYLAATPDDAALLAAPPKVQLIIKGMSRLGVISREQALTGGEIVDMVKNHGGLRTKSGSAELFAYYRHVLDKLGVVHAA